MLFPCEYLALLAQEMLSRKGCLMLENKALMLQMYFVARARYVIAIIVSLEFLNTNVEIRSAI